MTWCPIRHSVTITMCPPGRTTRSISAAARRKFFGEPSLAAFDLEHFSELIRPWPTGEAYDRFVDAVDLLATAAVRSKG